MQSLVLSVDHIDWARRVTKPPVVAGFAELLAVMCDKIL
jgi:hypothetical protein